MLSRYDAAKRLCVSLSTLDRMIAAGELPVIRIGRLVRVEDDVLNRWIAEKAGRSSSDND